MPTLDTNVFVHLLVSDDPKEARRAEALAKDAERTGKPLFVPTDPPLLLMSDAD